MSNPNMDHLDKAHEKGVVLGLAGFGTGQRLDIDVMLTEQPDTFNLYLIALMELQGMDNLPWDTPEDYSFKAGSKNLKMSWFQLTGIHGLPLSAWDNVGTEGYYCAHAEPYFGTWHRPFLAIVEQTLFRQVANVAERFSKSDIPEEQKKKYLAAAQQFRLPYWDYYRPRSYTKTTFPGVTNPKDGTATAPFDWGAPQIFTLPEVMVRRLPDNELVPMTNPFFQYEFTTAQFTKISNDKGYPNVFANVKKTIRYGGSDEKATQSMNEKLNSVREDRVRLCLALIEDEVYRNFRTFATNAVLPKAKEKLESTLERPSGSIEDLHNGYHGTIGGSGGSGHMSWIETSAFDPIFWMHHCQIDRLFAVWQAANGDEHWFNELEPEDQPKSQLDLMPFRKSFPDDKEKQQYWNSDLARHTTDFGYTYPDTAKGQTGDTVRKEFREKYEWSRRTTAKPVFGTPPDSMQPVRVGDAQVFDYKHGTPSGDLFKPPGVAFHEMQQQTVMAAMSSNPQYADDWYIDIVVERQLANGTYTIYYIIGEVQGQTGEEWSSLPGFVGMSHILAAPRNICENCATKDEEGQLVTSTTPMTSLLLDYVQIGKLNSMGEDDVKKFLIDNLKWRAQTVAGEVLNPRDMATNHTFNLSISRKRTPVPRSAGDVQYKTYPEVIEAIIANSS
ncbi:tyrosinase precursor (monophenol monooxygenase) [Fusarium pseudocircinatum]|uniref:tyrosinase n=1 Tax=Fusarium pseudocircinatum TaxID=56676 RepID=A0A8H5L7U2_9HYPO|nr:tyrosinase precursor (monophenol monooxygenase) [Fusarium pseudocircinatum]